ncbi:MAG: starvation-sensing protein RspA [Mariniphaga sp.]|nr:starvation-sensing protein RspA [Mariniphaga sp.]
MNKVNNSMTGRRDLLKMLGLGSVGIVTASWGSIEPPASIPNSTNGLSPLKIKNVKAIGTAPGYSNLIIIKVETTEPGLYGLGCATYTQRALAVVSAINNYLPEFCIGRDAENVEDMWRALYTSSYWRNGPVLNNALSGLTDALWDIKAKRANMPLYQLLGGKTRFAIDCYAHASGRSPEQLAERTQQFMEEGYRHVRIQQGGYGGVGTLGSNPDFKDAEFGMAKDGFMDQRAYLKSVPIMFETVRKKCGEDVELLHDIHERCQPMDVINLCRQLEQYRPFFIEDPVSPENMYWFKQIRESTTVPFSMGELFNNVNEFLEPIANHLFDYIRCHVSQIGGITQARKIAHLGEWFNVKTAWHGPGDCSPIGHAANAHLELASWNFGIHEGGRFSEKEREVFSGCPTIKNGYMHVNEAPGHGVDINEEEAAKYPISNRAGNWTVRNRDGMIITP